MHYALTLPYSNQTLQDGGIWLEQPHSPDVNHCVFSFFYAKSRKVGSRSPALLVVGFEPGTFQFNHDAMTY